MLGDFFVSLIKQDKGDETLLLGRSVTPTLEE